ncbi:MAG: glycosyltransferase family 4 protein [Eubacteriales bacterium]|jgi:glycosyltransferase involved in cell wall biosynthesis|nr:glycosyltransferase family 4 protein [Eubacteriales bacterium]MDZ7610199.1 glycosyltransferase family 4 protein [Eubacteriales bacterium]
MGNLVGRKRPHSIAVLGTCIPRKCGIATFTDDLCEALEAELDRSCQVAVVAMDDVNGGYPYPKRVKFQIRDSSLPDYLRAAQFLNVNQPDILVVQHEYGIFGGKSGAHLLYLVKNLEIPIVTTLHTILTEPTEQQRTILLELAGYSEVVVTMSLKGRRILQEIYGIPETKIAYIPHGIPNFTFVDPSFYKDTLSVDGRKVILSFGLVHPGKGFELVIKALPQVIQKHPGVIYIILGATHPHVIKNTGDAYRHSLHQLVNRLGLELSVRFDNKYVNLDELCRYIVAADIFVSPNKSPAQITSGTLAYAVGAGKAVISTPYWHAEELLGEGRGRLVPFNDADAMASTINDLLDNEQECNAMRKRAYQFGRQTVWKEVARGYLDLFEQVLGRSSLKPKSNYRDRSAANVVDRLPAPNLEHLKNLTDDTGILQHCIYTTPNRNHGYCVDDNARALVVTSLYYSLYQDKKVIPLTHKYLSFLYHAFNQDTGCFRNFMSYNREWLEKVGSEDAHGRALWGLGVTVRDSPTESIGSLATKLFTQGLPVLESFTSPRAWAFALLGLNTYLDVYSGDAGARRLRRFLSERLHNHFLNNLSSEWVWCEEISTYDNAKLPHALLLSGRRLPDAAMFKTGLAILKWLLEQQTAPEGHLSLIGNAGWFTRDGRRAKFDQQPVDAMALVEACVEAFQGTGDLCWIQEAGRCLDWFLGYNDLNLPLYDFTGGGCRDGLEAHGVNANQGAESTLAWLISLLTIFEVFAQPV